MNKALHALLRPHYHDLKGYVSAGMEDDKKAEKIFLNANENPYELPGLETFNRYPEPQPRALANAYAKAYSVKPEHIVMTRGADEAIVILTKLFCEPHTDAVLICPPTFGMYGVNANACPATLREVPLIRENGSFVLDTQAIITAGQKDGVKLVYLCSPNNPTATSFDHAEILKIISALEGHAVVILDETYAEFSKQGSLAGKLTEHPNLIILRTLSKSYSMAGQRMGCFLCADTDFIALAKDKALDAYPLPHASVNAALHVLSDDIQPVAQNNIKKILTERDRIIPLLQEIEGIKHVYPSDANFLLVEMAKGEKSAADFITFAAHNNVVIRDFSTKSGTENCIRLSIGTPEQNDMVLKLLGGFAS